VRSVLKKLEQARALDGVSDRLQALLQAVVQPRAVRDALHGVWLGHPLHPVLVQLPVGAWLSAAVLDLVPGQERAATTLVAVGTAGALPAAAAGATDWSELSADQRRVGLVHAAANTGALVLFAGSVAARLTGRHRLGRTLSFLGLGIAGGSAYLGGHLSYVQGAQMGHSAPEMRLVPEGWHAVADLAALPEGKPVVRHVGPVPVLVYRENGSVTVFLERCSHQLGPLGEGDVISEDGEACVVCPWHGSTFRLRTGTVKHGPAANDLPALRVRVTGGLVEVSAP